MIKFYRLIMILGFYGFSFFSVVGLPSILLSTPQVAHAELPWEAPLCTLAKSLTGNTAKSIAMIGLFVAGGLLVFGGDLSDFAKRITWMCLAISIMLAGESFINMVSSGSASC